MILLTEILDNIEVPNRIKLEDPDSLAKTYSIDGGEINGYEAISKLVNETFKMAYNLKLEDVSRSNKDIDLTTGPEAYLVFKYKTKIVNQLASKYKFITKEVKMDLLETWNNFLKPSIFKEIIEDPETLNKLQDFNIDDFIPVKKKENDDQTVTSYSYYFYEEEKPEWKNNNRLKSVSISESHFSLEIELPVKLEPTKA